MNADPWVTGSTEHGPALARHPVASPSAGTPSDVADVAPSAASTAPGLVPVCGAARPWAFCAQSRAHLARAGGPHRLALLCHGAARGHSRACEMQRHPLQRPIQAARLPAARERRPKRRRPLHPPGHGSFHGRTPRGRLSYPARYGAGCSTTRQAPRQPSSPSRAPSTGASAAASVSTSPVQAPANARSLERCGARPDAQHLGKVEQSTTCGALSFYATARLPRRRPRNLRPATPSSSAPPPSR